MSKGIYLIQNDGQLVEMSEKSYDSTDLLQNLLVRYPNLLAGEPLDSAAQNRWLLITGDIAEGLEEGEDLWSIDNLFVDQNAVLTLAAIKRGSESYLNLEMVGQMLDYAANAVAEPPVDTLRARFEASCKGQDPEQVLGSFLEHGIDTEEFWEEVRGNLEAGRLRLLFVADEIPRELSRIIEFLNGQMNPAEVLGIEIRQYQGQGLQAIVPQVIGQTEEARQRKTKALHEDTQGNETLFFDRLDTSRGSEDMEVANQLLQEIEDRNLDIWWGNYKYYGEMLPFFHVDGKVCYVFMVYTDGHVGIHFKSLHKRPPFDDEARRMELLDRLNQLPGVAITKETLTDFGYFPLSVLKDETVRALFLEIVDWVIGECQGKAELPPETPPDASAETAPEESAEAAPEEGAKQE